MEDMEAPAAPAAGAAVAAFCDPNIVKQYLLNLVPVLLGGGDGDEEDEAQAVRAMFSQPESSAKCKSFANDSSIPALYVVKDTEGESGDQGGYSFSTTTFELAFELSWKTTHVGSLALIKRTPTIDPDVSLARQIQVMNLLGPASAGHTSGSGGAEEHSADAALAASKGRGAAVASASAGVNPYELLHAYVRFGVSPYFNAYVAAKEKADQEQQQSSLGGGEGGSNLRDDKDAQQGIPMAKKKLAELELSLLHLQQNVDIPETVLNIHPVIARTVAECRRQGQRTHVDAVDPGLLSDSGFLNQLQGDVNGWIKEIQKVTKLDRDPASGTTSQEINFWLSMERALERIEEQLQSDEVVLTMDVLKAAKRFHATVSFRTDTGLKEAAERVTRYNVLMKDFPVNELLSATDIGRISNAIEQIFAHVNKKLKLTAYPVRRALPLAEAISRDFNDQLVKVMGHVRLMHMDYADFDRLIGETQSAFEAWESQVKEFANLARDITRKRSEKFIPIKIRAAHAPLQERLSFVHQFRQQHEQLQQTIVRVMGGQHQQEGESATDESAISEISQAYDVVKIVDVLDVTVEGTELWERAETGYNERVARVENQIIVRLRDRLATARNASEMFRVFSKFNALFVRPKIRGAIQEYQTQLISSVKDDIRRLHDTFKKHYRRSEAYTMSQLRDVPPVSGAIIWIRQIERQLDMYMRRVEDVLGKGWELYAEGQRLQADSASFRRKLDTRPLYDAWFSEISRRDLTVAGRVFLVARHRATGNTFQLNVSFDAQLITLFKEVRELLWLGFQVPHTLVNMARDGRRVYPFAVSLMETVKIYRQTSYRLHQHPDVMPLAAGYRRDVMLCIQRGMALKWQYFVTSASLYTSSGLNSMDVHDNRNASFVREFAAVVSLFQEKVEALITLNDSINAAVRELSSCPYTEQNFRDILDRIQGLIDRLNLDNYANLEQWVCELDVRLEQVFTARLSHAVQAWIREFTRAPVQGDDSDGEAAGDVRIARRLQRSMGVDSRDLPAKHTGDGGAGAEAEEVVPQLRPVVHELRIKNQMMYVDPPLENARASWIQQLHAWLAAVCQQRRPQATRYEVVANADEDLEYDNLTLEYDPGSRVGDEADASLDDCSSSSPAAAVASTQGASYKDLLSRLPNDGLFEAYRAIEAMAEQAAAYVRIWLQYQALWDLQTDYVLQFLGDDLTRWQTMLLEIKRARSTFDTSETAKLVGAHCMINYELVQSKVNAKYDGWQREILNKFGQRLGAAIRDASQAIAAARHQLESHSAESSTTSEVVAFITYVQEIKRKCPGWQHDVEEVFRGGQRVLEKQRYQFPPDWVYLEQVEGEWSAFNEILKRKNNVIQEQLPNLQMKIIAEDQAVDARIGGLCADWEKGKPVQGSLKPDTALNTLNVFHQRITRLVGEYELVGRAKEALDMDARRDERLTPVQEEVGDLKSVWTALSGVWREINELRETPWASVVVRKVRQQLDRHLGESKQLPNRMRQYAAFEYMQKTLRALLKANAVVADLKSDALRDRHWRQLFKALKVPTTAMSDLTLGDVWDFDIARNESLIREVITVAQGEMALEEFLAQIRETWSGYVLELVAYQNKCRLIKGWDELFAKCSEQLSALTSMKGSPYYKVFEEEAGGWEDKLNRIHVLFDVWVDVQRQWVYLEGIFTGSADIKHMLPVESSRFQNINTEFLAVMKKVYKSPFVLDVLGLPSIQRSLERLADLLGKIQKALGEYLERERASFPRFYFVGDEDLLEIIGNAKDVPRIQKHLRKMFAGLAFVQLTDDSSQILGMSSKEGEQVPFRQPIVLAQYTKINEWLAAIEREMRLTLAEHLGRAIAQLETVCGAEPDAAGFRAWIAATPAQLVILAKQVVWTRRVDAALGAAANTASDLATELAALEGELHVLADAVLEDLPALERKKVEQLITELVHQRDTVRVLHEGGASSDQDFRWLSQMRFSYQPATSNPLDSVEVSVADARFRYGFEYLGVQERLVQTPLTDRCYLTLTQALERRLGGSPFGPAGTGKTETAKALAQQLGRFSLVFCCDENFDFQAMGRIFVGLCQVGAWGVFDEFNRLDERILSAVSQQIQTIQLGLGAQARDAGSDSFGEIELLNNKVRLNPDTGIFITMNPGYAGRSNLPDNLKKLFRSFAMTRPDRALIAQVMLYSQGFRQAEMLAGKVVPLFNLCAEQLSEQPHYDFGLRALKSVLVSAGRLKREQQGSGSASVLGEDSGDAAGPAPADEQALVIQSIRETMVPKLVAQDIGLLGSLLEDVFPGAASQAAQLERLRAALEEESAARGLVNGAQWVAKALQLYQMQALHHGVMMVGAAGSGKSTAWRVLLAALERLEGVEGVSYVIDPKAITKDELYGTLDATTREWRDGLFTHVLRKIVDNVRGESTRRHWIVFDGDVDPEWVENLNSVLDDNRLLTLPNGERLALPPNVRVLFEVETLRYATPATVSRCGMVWFSDDTVTAEMAMQHYLNRLRAELLDDGAEGFGGAEGVARLGGSDAPSARLGGANAPGAQLGAATADANSKAALSPAMRVQAAAADVLAPFLARDGVVARALGLAAGLEHVMEFTRMRALGTLFALLDGAVGAVTAYDAQHTDFPLSSAATAQFVAMRLALALVWSMAGDATASARQAVAELVSREMAMDSADPADAMRSQGSLEPMGALDALPPLPYGAALEDCDAALRNGAAEWVAWNSRVPRVELEAHSVAAADVVVPTADTLRHEDVVRAVLAARRPAVLCGPPGSGKTMTLLAALRRVADADVAA
ncbi:dynein heavy chain, partial [Coemansia guatemalensis]